MIGYKPGTGVYILHSSVNSPLQAGRVIAHKTGIAIAAVGISYTVIWCHHDKSFFGKFIRKFCYTEFGGCHKTSTMQTKIHRVFFIGSSACRVINVKHQAVNRFPSQLVRFLRKYNILFISEFVNVLGVEMRLTYAYRNKD